MKAAATGVFGDEVCTFTPFISPPKSRIKILISEWSEIFNSNWALKAQRKRELKFARQVLSEIFKAKSNRE